jgi:hypothetical protein
MTRGYEDMIQTLEASAIRGLEMVHHYTPGATHQTNPYYSMPAAIGMWARYLAQAD